jgi:hypothetical protein
VSDRLFSLDEVPEVPLLRAPARRKSEGDARFRNDYPPEWNRCSLCGGCGRVIEMGGVLFGAPFDDHAVPCPDCLGMGSLKAMTRLLAGHRCERCKHPYIPDGDAKMLGVEPSGMHECPDCEGWGRITDPDAESSRCRCGGRGRVWTPWSSCDEQCRHGGPLMANGEPLSAPDAGKGAEVIAWLAARGSLPEGTVVEAAWRILTVHHLDGDKANVQPWNLATLCQRDHLLIQSKVVMEQIYPHEHSPWFRWHAAGYYAWVYLGERLTRAEIEPRMDELLALEHA